MGQDQFNVLWKEEGATAADGAVTHGHLYRYTTGSGVVKLEGIEHLPPVRSNPQGVQMGKDYFLSFPCELGDGPGTATTAGSTTVTLSGAYATTAYGVQAGYLILIEGESNWIEIAAASGSTVTLSSAASTSASGKNYVVAPRGGVKLAGQTSSLTPWWIGIKTPATAATAVVGTSGGSLTTAVAGDYRFKYSYMNAAGRESNASPVQETASTLVGTDDNDKITVTLTAPSPADAQVISYRLYADKDASDNFWFVKEGDWTTTVEVTTDAELTLTGEQAAPSFNDAPLFPMSTMAVWRRRVFGAGDPNHPNWLYFTEQGEDYRESFPLDLRTSEHWHVEFANVGKITALSRQDDRLLIFGERSIYTLGGYRYITDSYNAVTSSDMSPVRICAASGVGCVAPDSLVDVNGERWFWSHRGLYRMLRGCPSKVTNALDAITARVTKASSYLSTATFDLNNDEYILCLPVDDSTTPNLTVRVNVNTLAVMVDDLEMQCVRRVKDDEVHVLSHTGVILKWDTASTYEDGPLGIHSITNEAGTTTTLVCGARFTDYLSSWGTLSGSYVMMLDGPAEGEIREILDVDDANTITLRSAFSAAPGQYRQFYIGGINFEYQFPWIRNESFEPNRKARLHLARLWLESQTTGQHTSVGFRGSDTPGSGTWYDRTTDTRNSIETVVPAKAGIWGKYLQARIRNGRPGQHIVLSGVSLELST